MVGVEEGLRVKSSVDVNLSYAEWQDTNEVVVTDSRPIYTDSVRCLPCNKRKRGSVDVRADRCVVLYDDTSESTGGAVKVSGSVLRLRSQCCERGPNVKCKVEQFSKLLGSLDELKKSWVREMGFDGLFYMVGLKLPKELCYWLMTRIDPVKERLNVGGVSFRISSNQVRWVLAIPKGDSPVPLEFLSLACYSRVMELERRYGQEWSFVEARSGRVLTRKGIAVSPVVVDRLIDKFEPDQKDEFKSLFLMAALDMVLCPTQCNRFPKELLPALSCAADARSYDWCDFVLQKLMASVKRFAARFYADGFAIGCGGCTLFVAILYLDRLKRNGVHWGKVPRIKAWSVAEVQKACDEDRISEDADFGAVGVLDIAYGEKHPYDARDAEYPLDNPSVSL